MKDNSEESKGFFSKAKEFLGIKSTDEEVLKRKILDMKCEYNCRTPSYIDSLFSYRLKNIDWEIFRNILGAH
jgi:hypothetical protein